MHEPQVILIWYNIKDISALWLVRISRNRVKIEILTVGWTTVRKTVKFSDFLLEILTAVLSENKILIVS